ncbi:hypothetical protein O181_008321 [Austropuccinia psidii MF-1]|uniref:Uncharacterized protein n=1 Tax=Austropuccinia psidii MF-1 TaxID=1389203 RepID=A0A9Q3BPM0_9BASI|nr:hypothetical protein [Austropuccinia psidii MF-1]
MILLGQPGANSETLEKGIALRPTIGSQTMPEDYGVASRRVEDLDWKLLLMNPQALMPPLATPIFLGQYWRTHSPQGHPIGVAPEVHILITRKDGRLGKLKENLVVQYEVDTDAEGSDELHGEELELTTPIPKKEFSPPDYPQSKPLPPSMKLPGPPATSTSN